MLSKMNFTTEQHMIIIITTVFFFTIWCIGSNFYYIESFSGSTDEAEQRIDNDDWTFFDKVLYGGLGYGNICLPTHLFKVMLTIIFPPLGIVLKHIKLMDDIPWIDATSLIMNVSELVKSLLLTAFFYIPGLIYSLNQLKCGNDGNCSVN
jgi:uncharacterized membrane protein YqaE (UPF0057 family)